MQQEIGEFFESVNDALVSAVTALGGNKKVGAKLRPEMLADQAGGWLRDCLNPDRREKLSPEQVMLIAKMAREAGYHSLMNFIAFDTGYTARPIDVETQEAILQEEFIAAVQKLGSIETRLGRVQRLKTAA